MRTALSRVSVAAALALLLAACGSASERSPSVRVSGFAAEAPARILATAGHAMESAKSVRISGTLDASNFKQGTITFAAVLPSRLSVEVSRGHSQAQIVLEPAGVDLRANLAYWDSKTSMAVARRYANRWLTLTGALSPVVKQLRSTFQLYTAKNFACYLARFPHPTFVRTTTVGAQASVELHSSGPSGHDSDDLYIAIAAPHYPLRTAISRHAAGQAPRGCPARSAAKSVTGDVTYSDWNAVTITAPAHATPVP